MGRKAKLKQMRREAEKQPASPEPTEQAPPDPTKFVQQLQQQGYQLKKSAHCPEIPDKRQNPQL